MLVCAILTPQRSCDRENVVMMFINITVNFFCFFLLLMPHTLLDIFRIFIKSLTRASTSLSFLLMHMLFIALLKARVCNMGLSNTWSLLDVRSAKIKLKIWTTFRICHSFSMILFLDENSTFLRSCRRHRSWINRRLAHVSVCERVIGGNKVDEMIELN